MSSTGINAVNSGPLIIRTVLDSSINNTYVVGKYDFPVSTNYVLITSTNGVLAPTNTPNISAITVSSLLDRDGTAGAAGEVLHTDGSTTYWAPVGAGSGYWSETTGSTIYNNNIGGNVLIGSTAYNISTTFLVKPVYPNYNEAVKVELGGANLNIYRSTVNGGNATFINNTGGGQLVLGTLTPSVFIDGSNGNVGIQNAVPEYTLDVEGNGIVHRDNTTSTIISMSAYSNVGHIEVISSGNTSFKKGLGLASFGGTVGVGLTPTYFSTLQVSADNTGLTGMAANSSDVNTIIGAYTGGVLSNVGSVQATSGNASFTPYTLALNPKGGPIYLGSTTQTVYSRSELSCSSIVDVSSINGVVYPPVVVTQVQPGTAISVTGTATQPVINNTGVTQITAGTGISVNQATGNVTISAPGSVAPRYGTVTMANSGVGFPANTATPLGNTYHNITWSAAMLTDFQNGVSDTNGGWVVFMNGWVLANPAEPTQTSTDTMNFYLTDSADLALPLYNLSNPITGQAYNFSSAYERDYSCPTFWLPVNQIRAALPNIGTAQPRIVVHITNSGADVTGYYEVGVPQKCFAIYLSDVSYL